MGPAAEPPPIPRPVFSFTEVVAVYVSHIQKFYATVFLPETHGIEKVDFASDRILSRMTPTSQIPGNTPFPLMMMRIRAATDDQRMAEGLYGVVVSAVNIGTLNTTYVLPYI